MSCVTPSSSKKAKLSEKGRAKDNHPLKRAHDVREKVQKRLKLSDESGSQLDNDYECDIERNIREVQAILSTNEEIFYRCMRCRKQGTEQDDGNSTTFVRFSFDVVEMNTKKSTTQFIIYPQRSKKSFDTKPLSCLPACLDDIFIVKQMSSPFTTFIDYQLFFDNSLILHYEILGPFLAKLKDHLMAIQVCLGEIETWIMEASENIDYLEKTFAKKMDMPEADCSMARMCTCPAGTHAGDTMCLGCKQPLNEHRHFKHPDYSGYFFCPYEHEHKETKLFRCKRFQVLKECRNLSVKMEGNFRISNTKARKKLKKILELVAID